MVMNLNSTTSCELCCSVSTAPSPLNYTFVIHNTSSRYAKKSNLLDSFYSRLQIKEYRDESIKAKEITRQERSTNKSLEK